MNKRQMYSKAFVFILIIGITLGGWYVWQYFSVHQPEYISQGIRGTITIRSGNCMPGIIGDQPRNCSVATYNTPSNVVIKRPINLDDKENKEVVRQVNSVRGKFAVELEPGLYNIYVMYNGREYCNSFGGQRGEDCEFTVETGRVTDYTIQIDTSAS